MTIIDRVNSDHNAALGRVVAVEVRSVYGQDKIYPANTPAQLFASLTGTKTFSLRDLNHIQALGFEVAEIHKRKLPL